MRHTRLLVTGIAAVAAALAAPTPAVAARPLSATGHACTVLGTIGNDHLIGTHGHDVICGLGGDDVLDGGGGADILDGGAGNDVLTGGDGNDVLVGGSGDDTARGGPGNDYATGGDGTDLLDGGAGGDALDGGAGNDALDGDGPAGAVTPAPAADRLSGGPGDDVLAGGRGNDVLLGGTGDDRATGGDGNDSVSGDAGDDSVSGDNGNDTVRGGAGADQESGGAGNDTVGGNTGDDTLSGDEGRDYLDGGDDDDHLDGGRGDDRMEGGTGLNACVVDREDSSAIDRCTDKDVPTADIASLRWVTSREVDNAGDNVIRVRMHAVDDRSGLYYVMMKLRSPDPDVAPLQMGFHYRRLVAGTITNGVFEMEARLPASSPTGAWTVQQVYVQDRANRGNWYNVAPDGSYTTSSSNKTGVVKLPALVVSGVADVAGPVVDVAAARWETGTVLDNSADRTVTMELPVTDDLSGANSVSVTLDAPATDAPSIRLTAARPASGTALDGRWEVSGTVPAYTPVGQWVVSRITAADAAGHIRTVVPDGTGPAPLTVTGNVSDLLAPTADMTFAEYVGATSADNSADRTVTMRIRVGDDVSGVANVFLDYRTDGAQSRLDPIGPPDADGVWTLRGPLPASITPGQWRITGIYVTDRVGRQRVYYVQKDGSYTTSDGMFSGVARFPSFTLTAPTG